MNANATRLNTREAASSTHAHRRSVRREREFGTGYGRSSGYADRRHQPYVRAWRPGSFRVS